ncbi:PEP-CTERM sorting domain-containing protein [Crocosphaera sp. UHCC 0190]|uniref:PEP-CTERM sorting domain-containing protein n=1 Tax=Crocosphaera sp. UHCC 0190 TaxID=3110246 RepID=UPI002B220647|nr:PEP-CTERM sorting domain-containing protein [Crocosphaera sp. UHCC 0190]MEA5510437.1 PEP-CTERM sorting domain-containing protein [Crocosphaera sp. UHCC 0190]
MNTKAIVYSSIVAVLLSGTAAQAKLDVKDVKDIKDIKDKDKEKIHIPGDRPSDIDVKNSVNGKDIGFNLKLTGIVEIPSSGTASEGGGSGTKYDYIYELGDIFYINLETGEQSLGVAPEDAEFDYIQYDMFSTVLDPSGGFSVRFNDFGTPSTFSQTLNFPAFNPDIFGNEVYFRANLSGSLFDLTGDGVGITPTGSSTIVARLFDNDNAEIGNIPLGDAFTGNGGPAASYTYGTFSSELYDQDCGTTVGCGVVKMNLSFTGTGNGDRYNFLGGWFVSDVPPSSSASSPTSLSVASVPEPSTTGGLVGIGVLGLAFTRGKRALKTLLSKSGI